MAIASKIEWTDATWNPWQGCTKVSPACANCYMFRDLKRYGRDGAVVVRSKPPTFNLPLKRRLSGGFSIEPGSKVFTCSWSDWFHERADDWRNEAWAIIRKRPDVTFQIVTKRTERILDCLPSDWGKGYPNVWLIATAENQEWANRRLSELLNVPSVVRGLSCEPLLGWIDLVDIGDNRLHWVIAGGESGPGARPMHPDWVRSLRDQCDAFGLAFHFKQWGEWLPRSQSQLEAWRFRGRTWGTLTNEGEWFALATPWNGHDGDGVGGEASMIWVGKDAAGRLLDGRTWDEFPKIAS